MINLANFGSVLSLHIEAQVNLPSQLHQGSSPCIHSCLYLLPWELSPVWAQWLLKQPIIPIYGLISPWLQRKEEDPSKRFICFWCPDLYVETHTTNCTLEEQRSLKWILPLSLMFLFSFFCIMDSCWNQACHQHSPWHEEMVHSALIERV